MRDGAPDEVLAGACTWRPVVTSWLGGRMLAARVPISSGRVSGKIDDDVIETLSITVPRFAAPEEGVDVVDWRPSGPDSPLARYGQILDVTLQVSSVITGQVWETRIGRFQIKDWADDDGGTISVKGESLLARPRDDKIGALSSPTGTFMSEVRRLLPAGMGASFDPALQDRPVPGAMSWSKDRLKNLQEIAQAWPALLRVDPWGQVRFRAPLPAVPVPVLSLRDGRGGTLISAPRSDTRSGAYNQVVATTSNTDAADVEGVASITSGPMSVNGDYGVVTKEWSSPLLTTQKQAEAAAATMLANSTRPALAVPARIAPDPRIELDDAAEILRGARGRMVVVPAEYSPWAVQRRNLFSDPDPVSTTAPNSGIARWFYNGSTSAKVTIDPDGWLRMYADTSLSDATAARATGWGASGLAVVENTTYTLSFDQESSAGLADLRFAWWAYTATGTAIGGERAVLPSRDAAGRVYYRFTTPATTGRISFVIRRNPQVAWVAGDQYRIRHTLINEGDRTDYFDPHSPATDTRRVRFLGTENYSTSVEETRVVLVPEHRRWETESVDEAAEVDRQWGWVTAYDLPLTVADGDMRVDVGLS